MSFDVASEHDAAQIAAAFPPRDLAVQQVIEGDALPGGLPGIVANLVLAEHVGRLWRFFDEGEFIGYVASIRMKRENLELVARHAVKVFSAPWHDPAGDVVFTLECLARRPKQVEHYRNLFEGEQGVNAIAFWKTMTNGQHRLRLMKVRNGKRLQRQ